MGIITALQLINGSVGFYETMKAGNAVAALKASLKPSAQVHVDGMSCFSGFNQRGGGGDLAVVASDAVPLFGGRVACPTGVVSRTWPSVPASSTRRMQFGGGVSMRRGCLQLVGAYPPPSSRCCLLSASHGSAPRMYGGLINSEFGVNKRRVVPPLCGFTKPAL